MKPVEKVPVFIRIVNGVTVCICHVNCRGCRQPCPRGYVTRDRYEDWERTMKRGKYGK